MPEQNRHKVRQLTTHMWFIEELVRCGSMTYMSACLYCAGHKSTCASSAAPGMLYAVASGNVKLTPITFPAEIETLNAGV